MNKLHTCWHVIDHTGSSARCARNDADIWATIRRENGAHLRLSGKKNAPCPSSCAIPVMSRRCQPFKRHSSPKAIRLLVRHRRRAVLQRRWYCSAGQPLCCLHSPGTVSPRLKFGVRPRAQSQRYSKPCRSNYTVSHRAALHCGELLDLANPRPMPRKVIGL